jgi:pimeloyl-ACP methyl ester carboxylesterase
VVDALGAERLGVVGLSGGGPYALACAGSSALARRVAAVGVLGSVTPSVGPDAGTSGAIELARTFAPALILMPDESHPAASPLPVTSSASFACTSEPMAKCRDYKRDKHGRFASKGAVSSGRPCKRVRG